MPAIPLFPVSNPSYPRPIPRGPSDIGGFGGLFKPDMSGMAEPVLVASTDGVGHQQLKLAFAFDKHDTVGIDLVAMSANDILVQGARPCCSSTICDGKLDVDKTTQVSPASREGCKQAGCALLGGETPNARYVR